MTLAANNMALRRKIINSSDIVLDTGCWEWRKSINKAGYGESWDPNARKRVIAHRFSWQIFNGPIPEGLTIDHLCRNRKCVNPDHLEPVTNKENILRGTGPAAMNARMTHCPKGHPLNGANLMSRCDGRRRCRTCYNAWQRANYEKNGRQYARS